MVALEPTPRSIQLVFTRNPLCLKTFHRVVGRRVSVSRCGCCFFDGFMWVFNWGIVAVVLATSSLLEGK